MQPGSSIRIRAVNERPIRQERSFVLYWMISTRRPSSNFALDRAVQWARHLGKPLVVLEALRVDYPYASDRLHRFVMDGMAANRRAFATSPAFYYPYLERTPGEGRGLLAALAQHAAIVVTDEFPCFFLPQAVSAAGRRLDVSLEAVDSNGILPLAAPDRTFTAAVHFRRHAQKILLHHLADVPSARPFRGTRLRHITRLPAGVTRRWPIATARMLDRKSRFLSTLPIDHDVPAVPMSGGFASARRALQVFVGERLQTYHVTRNHPDDGGTSRLSPYLHFGHLSAHDILSAVMRHERWSLNRVARRATGSREGWWGVGPGANAFLDQLVIWRELAFNTCARRPDDYYRFESLPAWALKTLSEHEQDERVHTYSRTAFENAETHDPVWNAAQIEMRREGWFHNYMRMLWGKKILEWSQSPREALDTMITIMNRWSLDGRDPSSYAGYMWTLGRYDRPWPERPVYGKVRSMSSTGAARRIRLTRYLQTFRPETDTNA